MLFRSVLQTHEISFEPPEGNPAGRPTQSEKMEIEVINGKKKAVEFLVDFVSEHGMPAAAPAQKKSRKSKDAAPPGPPPPRRDWKPLGAYANTEEGNRQAQDVRERMRKAWDDQKAAREQYNKNQPGAR